MSKNKLNVIGLEFEGDTLDQFIEIAKKENRSIRQHIKHLVEKEVKEKK